MIYYLRQIIICVISGFAYFERYFVALPNYHLNRVYPALAGMAQWIECRLRTKGSLVQFPVRAHAWVAGQVLSGDNARGNHTLMFLSFSSSLPLCLKINK